MLEVDVSRMTLVVFHCTYIYNVPTNVAQHKLTVKTDVPTGQFIALQAINVLEESRRRPPIFYVTFKVKLVQEKYTKKLFDFFRLWPQVYRSRRGLNHPLSLLHNYCIAFHILNDVPNGSRFP